MKGSTIARIIWAVCVLAGVAIGVYFTTDAYQRDKDVVESRLYEGRVYFTEQGYNDFKQWLADNPDVDFEYELLLSSPDPLMDVIITTHGETESPYGQLSNVVYIFSLNSFLLSSFMIVLAGNILFWFFVWVIWLF